MSQMRKIGQTIQKEQDLTTDDIHWLIAIAHAILRAFSWDEGRPMRELAGSLGISPTTLYAVVRLAVEALIRVHRCRESVKSLTDRLRVLQSRLLQVTQTYNEMVGKLKVTEQALSVAYAKITALKAEVDSLKAQFIVIKDRMIIVLKMSGRCTVRSIVEVMNYGLGIDVSVPYVQGIICQAGKNAHSVFKQLLEIIPLSGAICIDEVFLKELGKKVLGVVIVDPLSGLILRLERCSERSKDAIGAVIRAFAESGFKDRIKICLTDMYAGYLEPVKSLLPKAVHQFCWFHINCFHIGATVYQAKRAYERAAKNLNDFDKKHPDVLTEQELQKRKELTEKLNQAQQHWEGAKRFQALLMRLLWSSTLNIATARLEQLIRVASRVKNPYIQKMGIFLSQHKDGLLVFYTCVESTQHVLMRLSRSKQKWVSIIKRWAVPTTSNAAEHVFRCLRRYTKGMDHLGTEDATNRFFDLFAVYHNVRILRAGKRAGNSLLAASHVNVKEIFGTDDPYTMLGFPSASQRVIVSKTVHEKRA